MTDFKVPDGVEPVVGWRYWYLETQEVGTAGLVSLHREEWWLPGVAVRAECKRLPWESIHLTPETIERHEAPEEGCSCGIYAAKSIPELRAATQVSPRRAVVVGEAHLWGRVTPGEHGYRAEVAYPRSLYVVDSTVEDIDAAERALEPFAVPVGRMGADVLPSRHAYGGMVRGTVVAAVWSPSPVQMAATRAQAKRVAEQFERAMRDMAVTVTTAATALQTLADRIDGRGETEKDIRQFRLQQRMNWQVLNRPPRRSIRGLPDV